MHLPLLRSGIAQGMGMLTNQRTGAQHLAAGKSIFTTQNQSSGSRAQAHAHIARAGDMTGISHGRGDALAIFNLQR